MGMLAMTFASCTRDLVKETNNGRAIDFRVATRTKATETTTANLSTFYVTALDAKGENYFTDAAFTKLENYFSSSPAYYWPGDGSNLSFYAYAPSASDLGATVSITSSAKKITGFSPETTITDQKDLIISSATGSKSNESSGVPLTFSHILSQIEIKARNANEGYVYKIRGIRIAQAKAAGEYDFETSLWTMEEDAEKATYEVTYTTPVTLDTYARNIMETEGDNAMLIPQQLTAWIPETDKSNAAEGAYISVYANIETTEGAPVYPSTEGEYAWIAVPADTKWEPGYKYVYTLDFTNGAGYVDPEEQNPGEEILGSPIKFTVASVQPWGEQNIPENEYALLNGKWTGKKAIVTKTENQEEISYDTEDKVKEFFDIYYKIEISDASRMYIEDDGVRKETQFTIKDEKMYMQMLSNPDGSYICTPHIDVLNETELILTIEYTYETQEIYFNRDTEENI